MSEFSPYTKALIENGRRGERIDADRKARIKNSVVTKVAITAAIGVTAKTASAKLGTSLKLLAAVTIAGGAATSVAIVHSQVTAPEAVVATTSQVKSAPKMAPAPRKPPSTVGAPASVEEAAKDEKEPAPIEMPALETKPVPRAPKPKEALVASPKMPTAAPKAIEHQASEHLSVQASGAPNASSHVEEPAPRSNRLTLAEEADLMRRADQSLRAGDPHLALRLLDEHAARFPQSSLAPERSIDRVLALCRLGRTEEARKARESAERGFGRSVGDRLAASCAARDF